MKFRELFAKEGLSLDRLHTLVLVADAGNIAGAAPNNKDRQGQFSRQLGELERFFDVELKRKNGRTVRLTHDGLLLAALAREHLQMLGEFKRKVDGRPFVATLAAGAALHEWVVLPRMNRLRDLTQPVVWQLHTRKNTAMRQQLLEGMLDLALLRSDLTKPGEQKRLRGGGEWGNKAAAIASVPLGTIDYSVFVPAAVCASGKGQPLRRVLADLPIATQGDDTQFQIRLEAALAKREWRLNAVFYGETFTQVAGAVAGGTMAGILPDIAAKAFDPAKVWRLPLKELPELRREVCLAWNPARHERLTALDELRPVVEQVLKF